MSSIVELNTPASSGTIIPLCVPEVRGNEWKYIKDCLDTGWVSSVGGFVDRFEKEFAAFVGSKHAVATVNGTSALHVALMVSGVEPDDEVLVSNLTFIAPANAIRYVGAWPVFIDAEPKYWQMDTELLNRFLKEGCIWSKGVLRNRATKRRIRAVLPVHILGHPVEMDPILDAAKAFGLSIIEDATESLGATYRGRQIGTLGQIGCFSFNGNKLLTTGGGGMLVTDDDHLANQARYLTTQAKDDPIEYIHHAIGFNYRLTNTQAAMGVAQLEQVQDYLQAKHRIATKYNNDLLGRPGVTTMPEAPWARSSFWMYTALFRPPQLDSRTILNRLLSLGIQTRPLWQPLHKSPAHQVSQAIEGSVSEHLYANALSLPCSVGLTASDQQRVIEALALLADPRS